MGRRARVDDPVWVACCCGGLPVIGIAKGLMTCVPLCVYFTVGVAAITLIWLPHSVWYTYKTMLYVRRLGPNLRALCLLLLPLPLLCWVPLATLLAALVSFLGGLIFPLACTFSDDSFDGQSPTRNSNPLLTGGVGDSFSIATEKLRDLWQLNRRQYFLFLDAMRKEHGELKQGEKPFDVSIKQLILTLMAAAQGVLIVFPLCALLICFYALPALLRSYVHLWQIGRDMLKQEWVWAAMLLPVWLLAHVLLPPLFAVVLALGFVGALGAGVGAAPVYFQHGWRAALRWSLRIPCDSERAILDYVDCKLFRPAPPRKSSRARRSTSKEWRPFLLRSLDSPRDEDDRQLSNFPSGVEMRERAERMSAAVAAAAPDAADGHAAAAAAPLAELPVHNIADEMQQQEEEEEQHDAPRATRHSKSKKVKRGRN